MAWPADHRPLLLRKLSQRRQAGVYDERPPVATHDGPEATRQSQLPLFSVFGFSTYPPHRRFQSPRSYRLARLEPPPNLNNSRDYTSEAAE
jgi:hypothetical protein